MIFVALLRGLNVGAHNRITMKDLSTVFERAGCADVTTYIQSGNVLFDAPLTLVKRLPGLIAKSLAAEFDITSPVVLRDGKELASVAKNNPFLKRGDDVSTLHVVFLAQQPEAAKAKALDPARSPPDEFVIKGRELYLHCPFMDVNMEGMDGFAATRGLQRDPSTMRIPVVMVTSKGQKADLVWARMQGAKGYVVKPYKDEQILDQLGALIGQF